MRLGQAVVNETVDDEATRAELLAAMASTESVRDLLGASLAAKDQQLSSLQSVLQVQLSSQVQSSGLADGVLGVLVTEHD